MDLWVSSRVPTLYAVLEQASQALLLRRRTIAGLCVECLVLSWVLCATGTAGANANLRRLPTGQDRTDHRVFFYREVGDDKKGSCDVKKI